MLYPTELDRSHGSQRGTRSYSDPSGIDGVISQRSLKPANNFDPAQDADLTYTPILFSKDSVYAMDVGDDIN
jgi:hypothetical protein